MAVVELKQLIQSHQLEQDETLIAARRCKCSFRTLQQTNKVGTSNLTSPNSPANLAGLRCWNRKIQSGTCHEWLCFIMQVYVTSPVGNDPSHARRNN